MELHFSSLDFTNTDEIKKIAKLHLEVPLGLIPDYQVTEDHINQIYQALVKNDPDTHLIVARDAEQNLIGFHWITLLDQATKSARIDSLWVAEHYRRQGIAQKLKSLGEKWMKE